jgi:hypothetical protein
MPGRSSQSGSHLHESLLRINKVVRREHQDRRLEGRGLEHKSGPEKCRPVSLDCSIRKIEEEYLMDSARDTQDLWSIIPYRLSGLLKSLNKLQIRFLYDELS